MTTESDPRPAIETAFVHCRRGGPWISAWRRYSFSARDEDLTDNFCTNNENVEHFLKLAEQERAKQ